MALYFPPNPTEGQTHFDDSNGVTYTFKNGGWVASGGTQDDLDLRYVEVDGDNMTGSLTLGPVGDNKITLNAADGSINAGTKAVFGDAVSSGTDGGFSTNEGKCSSYQVAYDFSTITYTTSQACYQTVCKDVTDSGDRKVTGQWLGNGSIRLQPRDSQNQNILLNATDGSAQFNNQVKIKERVYIGGGAGSNGGTTEAAYLQAYGDQGACLKIDKNKIFSGSSSSAENIFVQCSSSAAPSTPRDLRWLVTSDGSHRMGGTLPTSPNITLNATTGQIVTRGNVNVEGPADNSGGGRIICGRSYSSTATDRSGVSLQGQGRSDWGSVICQAKATIDTTISAFVAYFGNEEKARINYDGSATFAADASINGVTVGMGGGGIATNTVVGISALNLNTTGKFNTAIGQSALYNNTEGINNTALGRACLFKNTTGVSNTAAGFNALNLNTTGNYNAAFGDSALAKNTEGNENTGCGYGALILNTAGSYNTAVGKRALHYNTTGSGNIGIGFTSNDGTYTPVFNPTIEDNRCVMGHTAITNAYVKVAWTVTSDARDKTNFGPVPHGLDFVKQLQPTAYQFTKDRLTKELSEGPVRYGFKAQDILALEGDNPVIIDNEDPEHLKYRGEALVPVLINAIKEQQVLIEALTARLDAADV